MVFQSYGINSFTQESIHQAICRLLESEKKGTLLDIGSGTGALSQKLQDRGFEVQACDLNPQNFIPQNIFCQKVDLNATLPYIDRSFDYVTGAEVIEHVENPWHLLRELFRITRPDGIVVLSTPNLHNWYVRLYFFLTSKLYNFLSSYEKIGHITPVFIWNLERMATGRFKFLEVCTSHSIIPGLNLPLPFKGLFWGQCVVVKMQRNQTIDEQASRTWYN